MVWLGLARDEEPGGQPALPSGARVSQAQSYPPPLLSLVICTLDEAEAIGTVLDELGQALTSIPHEIIVVDDSTDEATARVVLSRQALWPRVRLIRRHHQGGLASAAIAGWDAAVGPVLGVMDGDGQHDPAVVVALLEALGEAGADIAIGSRDLHRDSGLTGFRLALSRAGTALTGLMLRAPVADPLSGLFLMRRDWFAAARPRLSGVGFKILVDVLASGPRRPAVVQRATALRPRAGGCSKLDARIVADLAALLIEKKTGGVVSARFALFAGVGAVGVMVNAAVVILAQAWGATSFAWTAAAATLVAMACNFALNNLLTFRDRRLHGAGFWRGLLLFCAACTGGAVLAEIVGLIAVRLEAPWVAASIAGAFAGALFNYTAASVVAWRRPQPAVAAPATTSAEVV
jgi:dolichol-phosphate mannosyltransferase